MIRTDNGSQFIANGLQKYLKNQHIAHEFKHCFSTTNAGKASAVYPNE